MATPHTAPPLPTPAQCSVQSCHPDAGAGGQTGGRRRPAGCRAQASPSTERETPARKQQHPAQGQPQAVAGRATLSPWAPLLPAARAGLGWRRGRPATCVPKKPGWKPEPPQPVSTVGPRKALPLLQQKPSPSRPHLTGPGATHPACCAGESQAGTTVVSREGSDGGSPGRSGSPEVTCPSVWPQRTPQEASAQLFQSSCLDSPLTSAVPAGSALQPTLSVHSKRRDSLHPGSHLPAHPPCPVAGQGPAMSFASTHQLHTRRRSLLGLTASLWLRNRARPSLPGPHLS